MNIKCLKVYLIYESEIIFILFYFLSVGVGAGGRGELVHYLEVK